MWALSGVEEIDEGAERAMAATSGVGHTPTSLETKSTPSSRLTVHSMVLVFIRVHNAPDQSKVGALLMHFPHHSNALEGVHHPTASEQLRLRTLSRDGGTWWILRPIQSKCTKANKRKAPSRILYIISFVQTPHMLNMDSSTVDPMRLGPSLSTLHNFDSAASGLYVAL